jgi:hypothetical protein
MLTKADVKALRNADSLCVHLSRDYTAVRAIKRKRYGDADPFATDQEHIVSASVALRGFRGRDGLADGRVKCFAMINLYPSQKHNATLILHTLREGDQIAFQFSPDGHTNGYLSAAGLHGDALYMRVLRQGKFIAEWEMATSFCPSNSARMICGVPNSAHYEQDAAEARKVA